MRHCALCRETIPRAIRQLQKFGLLMVRHRIRRQQLNCPARNVTLGQELAVVINELSKTPERWNEPFLPLALSVLATKFPCPQ